MKKKVTHKHLSAEEVKDIADAARAKTVKDLTRYSAPYVPKILVSPEQVKEARRAAGMSQPEFASALGFSAQTIKAWEQAWRYPDVLASKVIRMILEDPKFVRRLLAIGGKA